MSDRPRVLALAPELPFPPSNGLRLRIWQALKALLEVADVTLLSFHSGDAGSTRAAPSEAAWDRLTIRTIPAPASGGGKRLVQGLATATPAGQMRFRSSGFRALIQDAQASSTFDYRLILGGDALLSYASDLSALGRVGIDLCDDIRAAYLTLASAAPSVLRRGYLRFQARVLERSVRRDLQAVTDVVFISAKDGDWLGAEHKRKVRVVGNWVSHDFFEREAVDRARSGGATILFVGAAASADNRDAVDYFCSAILPLVQAKKPDFRFRVVGSGMDRLSAPAGVHRVDLVGFVDDLAEEYQRCDVFVCPLRSGSGVKNKVLEAMASACPIVSTPVGVEGIGVRSGQQLLVAEAPTDVADAVIRVLDDSDLGRALGSAARDFARRTCSAGPVVAGWQALIREDALRNE